MDKEFLTHLTRKGTCDMYDQGLEETIVQRIVRRDPFGLLSIKNRTLGPNLVEPPVYERVGSLYQIDMMRIVSLRSIASRVHAIQSGYILQAVNLLRLSKQIIEDLT